MQAVCEILGSGTSVGVPMPGCDCSGCTSPDERDQRLRSSARLTINGFEIIIDTSTDLRQQALRCGLRKIDAILLTHNHADHVFGLDDVRPFCFRQEEAIPLYGSAAALRWVRKSFDYIWDAVQTGGGLPKVALYPVRETFSCCGLQVTPIPVLHGKMEIFGYRVGDFAYISDVSHIPDSSMALLKGVKRLVLDGLRYREHPTHFSIDQAVTAAGDIGAEMTWLTHINHECLHAQLEKYLPENVQPAYDGLRFTFNYEA